MKMTRGAMHLKISVDVQALERYPAGCGTETKITLEHVLLLRIRMYMH